MKRPSWPKTKDFDLAILDVNLDGQDVYPVADLIGKRGLPFMFVTGYGGRGLPDNYRDRPTLQKPFQLDELKRMLAQVARRPRNAPHSKTSARLRQVGLVRHIEPQRRDRDAIIGQRPDIGAVARRRLVPRP